MRYSRLEGVWINPHHPLLFGLGELETIPVSMQTVVPESEPVYNVVPQDTHHHACGVQMTDTIKQT